MIGALIAGVGWLIGGQIRNGERLARIEQRVADLSSHCPGCNNYVTDEK